jgi:hypothetical protein
MRVAALCLALLCIGATQPALRDTTRIDTASRIPDSSVTVPPSHGAGTSAEPPSSREAWANFWPVLWDILKIALGATAAYFFTRWNERQKAEDARARDRELREEADARERRNREEAERRDLLRREAEGRRAEERIRLAIATDVTSIRTWLFPIHGRIGPANPATSEQVARVRDDAKRFRAHIDKLPDLRDDSLQQTVLNWYLNLDRAADALLVLSTEEPEARTTRDQAVRDLLTRMGGNSYQEARRRLRTLIDEGAQLELIVSVYRRGPDGSLFTRIEPPDAPLAK